MFKRLNTQNIPKLFKKNKVTRSSLGSLRTSSQPLFFFAFPTVAQCTQFLFFSLNLFSENEASANLHCEKRRRITLSHVPSKRDMPRTFRFAVGS